jgi:D-glycero-alpha-D-manno-heptose-7-phosphate kinase
MPHKVRQTLERRVIVFYTGITRNASHILKQQSEAVAGDDAKQGALLRMVELTYQFRDELQAGALDSFGEILHENWRLKRTLAPGVSTGEIDDWYAAACAAGASGGKILGAGSGGFLMFYAHEDRHAEIERALSFLRRVDFGFDQLGSRIIFYNPTNL